MTAKHGRLTRRIIVDGVRVEGPEARRIVDEVLLGVDDTGSLKRRFPYGFVLGAALCGGVTACSTWANTTRVPCHRIRARVWVSR